MNDNWRDTYQRLQDYMNQYADIEILPESVCIPGEVRPGFYRLFDTVTQEFIKEHFPRELSQAYLLSENWHRITGQVTAQLNLSSIEVPLHIKWFLDNPLDGLSRTLFDSLFDVLKHRKDLVEFEVKDADAVEHSFIRFFREGYRRWAILALIKELSPDRLFVVKGQDLYNDANLSDGTGGTGTPSGEVPEAEESNVISFVEAPVNAFLVPKIIGHSERLGAFVSLRPDFHESSWNSRTYSDKQEWLEIPTDMLKKDKSMLWPDMVMYAAANLGDIKLVADYSHIARPDVNIEFRENSDWYASEGLENIKLHAAFLKPRHGSFVVCLEPVPEEALSELNKAKSESPVISGEVEASDMIRLLHVGYNSECMKPIIEILKPIR